MIERYDIHYFLGDQTNVREAQEWFGISFEQLAEKFSDCKKGKKHEAYFVRGKLDPVARADKNLKNSRILVIDGDCGPNGKNAPGPRHVHVCLKELGLNHFIYTTHSHSKEQNKFRVVVPCTVIEKVDLKINIAWVLQKLKGSRLLIEPVTEMFTWSQPWFVPTRDNPNDGLFEFYEFHEGSILESKKGELKEGSRKGIGAEAIVIPGSSTLDELYENIRSGKEYHESMRTISFQLIKDGVTKAHTKTYLRNLMNGGAEAGTERWMSRYNDIDRLVDGVSVDTPSISELNENMEHGMPVPHPPGLLGKLFDEVNECLRYPDDKIAMVSTLFSVASIVGRKFNVDFADRTGCTDPTACNLYMTLVGDTGVGKDEPKRIIEKILHKYGTGEHSSFFKATDFTSVKGMFSTLKDRRSIGILGGEAGINMQSKAGDKASVKAMTLSTYGRGHWNAWTDSKVYSDSENSVEALRAVALTRLSESTQSELFKAYNDQNAAESGLIPRESVFRITNPNDKVNRKRRTEFSVPVGKRFTEIIKLASEVQAESDPMAIMIYAKDEGMIEELYNIQDDFRKISLDPNKDRMEQIMASRMFVKILRFTGVAMAFNGNGEDCITIGRQELNWAIQMTKWEMDSVLGAFAGISGVGSIAIHKLAVCISKIANRNGSKEIMNRMTIENLRRGIIPVSILQRALRQDKDIKELSASGFNGQINDGVMKCVYALVNLGCIELIEYNSRGNKVKAVKIGEGFDIVFKDTWQQG